MTSLKVGDLVELHPGTGQLGTVLDVVESDPRWLLVYWHTPPNICINPLLENSGRYPRKRMIRRPASRIGSSPSRLVYTARYVGGLVDRRPVE